MHRVRAQHQLGRDLAVGHDPGDQAEHLELALDQLGGAPAAGEVRRC